MIYLFRKFESYFTIFLLLTVLVSCKKGELIDATPVTQTPAADTAQVVETVVAKPSTSYTTYELGTGSGALLIDGTTLKLSGNPLIKIKAGTYSTIIIKNISGTTANPIMVKNNGLVTVTEYLQTENIAEVTIAGDNDASQKYGFVFKNIGYRAIMMNGKMSGVTISNMSFTNVANYVIAGTKTNGDDFNYTGSASTRTERFKILNCLFDNVGSIVFGGSLNSETGADNGFFKDVEIASNIFQNSAGVGSVCSFTNVQDYDIHNNVVNNINQSQNNHNGVFFMQGNGKFHDNKLTNYQGNAIRMWLYSRGSTPATNEIYNNICYNTRKYSGFELQGFARNIYSGKSTYANAKVYNNTVGTMNTSKDWEGQLLDLYNYTGTLEYYNNLGFNLYTANKITDMINNMSNTKIITSSNNRYVATQNDAVQNVISFVSKISGIGSTLK